MNIRRTILVYSVMVGVWTSSVCAIESAPIQPDAFKAVPNATKVHAWWHWISGNITKEGITKDLESMNTQGVSQVTILNVGGFVSSTLPVPNVTFDSPQWYDMFQFSLTEAKRLGMTVGVHNCDGWSTSGGPWISPEHSMKEFVWSRTSVKGGTPISMKLPQPPTAEAYYQDFAVVAFPNVHEENAYVKANPDVQIKKLSLKRSLSDGNPLTQTSFDEKSSITVSFDAPYETDEVLILPHIVFAWDAINKIPMTLTLSSSTDGKTFTEVETIELLGANVPHRVQIPKTTARYFRLTSVENENKCSIAEFELLRGGEAPTYLTGIHGLLQKSVAVKTNNDKLYEPSAPGGQAPVRENQVIDLTSFLSEDGVLNWPAPEGNWSIVRFGYTSTGMKNKPATPEGTGLEVDKMDARAAKEHFDAFTGKLLKEAGPLTGEIFKFILIDSWECHYQNWTHAFPEEFQIRRGYDITPWIPVLCGEIVESAELSDGFLHDFRRTIADLIDQNYYQARAQYLLQKGQSVVDCIFYVGDQYPQARTYPILKELPFGIRANPCNWDMLKTQASIINGKLSLGGMQQFALLALPDRESLELETLKLIESLLNDGLVVYGPRPARMLGALEISTQKDAFEQLVHSLWGDATEERGDRRVGKGRVIWGTPIVDVLGNLDVTPDLASTTASWTDIMYIHKRTPNEEIYFVFNQTEEILHTELLFRVAGKQPEIWQAQTGEVKEQPIYVIDENQTRIPVTFKPSESFFFVFRTVAEKPNVTKVMKNGERLFPEWKRINDSVPMATYVDGDIQFTSDVGGAYTFELSNGSRIEKNLSQSTVIDVGAGTTEVVFEPIYDAPFAPITMSPLRSITELDEPAIQYFAGTLKYTLTFEVSQEQLKKAESALLDFGKFDATAAVALNGKPIGKIWTHDTALAVRGLLQEDNTLEVTLATTCRNRLIGDLREYGEIRTIFTTAPTVKNKMLDARMPLKPTGLMGPVTLSMDMNPRAAN